MCLHLCCGLICLIYGIGNRFYLGVGHGLMTRKTELTLVDALSYGERQMVPLTVATLPVRRYGIMDDGAYAPYPLNVPLPLQFAQSVPHHSAAHVELVRQLNLGGQMVRFPECPAAQLRQHRVGDLAGDQFPTQPGGGVTCFFHRLSPFLCQRSIWKSHT